MTIYSELQQNVTEFRNAQDNYWSDLQKKMLPFHSDMLIYYGVAGKTLRFDNDKETSVIVFGKIENGAFAEDMAFRLERDEDNLQLKFAVRVYLSRSGSEMVDTALAFNCAIGKNESGYCVTVVNQVIPCSESNGKLNFTDVFDYMLQRLYQFTDKSKF